MSRGSPQSPARLAGTMRAHLARARVALDRLGTVVVVKRASSKWAVVPREKWCKRLGEPLFLALVQAAANLPPGHVLYLDEAEVVRAVQIIERGTR